MKETAKNRAVGGLHILVIPSEEFQPPASHLAGIFQRHQCTIMHRAGWHVGVLSVRLQFSVAMILKCIAGVILRRPPKPGLEGLNVPALVILLTDKLLRPGKFVSHDTIDGYHVVRISGLYLRRPSLLNDHRSWIRAGRTGFADYCLRYGAPDIIHAHNCNPAGLLALDIHKVSGIPYMITEHSSYYHRKLIPTPLLPRLAKAFQGAKVVAAVSPSLGQSLSQDVGADVGPWRWIPNVLDPEFENAELPERRKSDGCDFLAIGDLIPLKGHRELIEAFAKAFRGQLDVCLQIAGDGILASELSLYIDELGVNQQVRLLGRISREQVKEHISHCDCLVLPSHYETFGVVLIEALAMGRPVIASRCGGPDSIVNDSNGILVPPEDVSALAETLTQMRVTFSKYDENAIRRDALSRFGRQQLLENLAAAYRDCVCLQPMQPAFDGDPAGIAAGI